MRRRADSYKAGELIHIEEEGNCLVLGIEGKSAKRLTLVIGTSNTEKRINVKKACLLSEGK